MKTALMQRLAAGAAMSAVLAIGHPASADEPLEADSPGLTLGGVALPRVLHRRAWPATPASPPTSPSFHAQGRAPSSASRPPMTGSGTETEAR